MCVCFFFWCFSFFLQGFFAKMERSMLAADAEKVVAKGEMTEEEKEVARREAQAHAAHPDEEVVEDATWRNVALDCCGRAGGSRKVGCPPRKMPGDFDQHLVPTKAVYSCCRAISATYFLSTPKIRIQECKEVDVVGILKSLKTCPDAYAIFETEAARDAAVEATVQSGGVEFGGNTLKLNASSALAWLFRRGKICVSKLIPKQNNPVFYQNRASKSGIVVSSVNWTWIVYNHI